MRIFYSPTPYRGKFMLSGNGTETAPIRVCGVKGSAGERPIIDGQNAKTRLGLAYGHILHQTRSVIVVKPLLAYDSWTKYPTYIQIDGLDIRGANPSNTFTDASGTVQSYVDFGACIWVDRGHNITIADNVIHDCTNGIFTKSTDDGEFAVTKNLRIAGNYIYGNGVAYDVHMHNSYVQSVNVVYEFNRYGPLRANAPGNMIKDRSVGTVIRYNHLKGGAHSIDLVEAEDFPYAALANPAYRTTYVYGNIISTEGVWGSAVHYGGDHYGSAAGSMWGEPIFRKGTLYFYSNTVSITGTGSSAALFQISSTDEKAEIWNNIFTFGSGVQYPALRQNSELSSAWVSGGIVNLGKNWTTNSLADSDPWHPIPGSVTGWSNSMKGTGSPVSLATFVPTAGSAVIDTAQGNLSAVSAYPVLYQLDMTTFQPKARTTNGSGADLGAIEK